MLVNAAPGHWAPSSSTIKVAACVRQGAVIVKQDSTKTAAKAAVSLVLIISPLIQFEVVAVCVAPNPAAFRRPADCPKQPRPGARPYANRHHQGQKSRP